MSAVPFLSFFRMTAVVWLVFRPLTLLGIASRTVLPYVLAKPGCRWDGCKGPESTPSPVGPGAWKWVELELLPSKEEV